MSIVIDDRGRVTLPQELRDSLGIRPGQEVLVERTEQGLLIRRATTPKEFIAALEGCFDSRKTGKPVDPLKLKDMWGAFHDHDGLGLLSPLSTGLTTPPGTRHDAALRRVPGIKVRDPAAPAS